MWSAGQNPSFREENFNTKNGEEGGVEMDRPLIIQVSSKYQWRELADPPVTVLRQRPRATALLRKSLRTSL